MALLLILLQITLVWQQIVYSGEQKKGNDAVNPQSGVQISEFGKRKTFSDAEIPQSISRMNSWKGKRGKMSGADIPPSIFRTNSWKGQRETMSGADTPLAITRLNSWEGKRETMSGADIPPSIFKKPGLGKRDPAVSD